MEQKCRDYKLLKEKHEELQKKKHRLDDSEHTICGIDADSSLSLVPQVAQEIEKAVDVVCKSKWSQLKVRHYVKPFTVDGFTHRKC